MDLFPLLNSLRVAFIATAVAFFTGVFAAYYIERAPRLVRGVLDMLLTLPLVLPPTVIGFVLLKLLGPRGPVGSLTGARLVMVWYSAAFASLAVSFPLMYRTARGAFGAFDHSLRQAGQTLGRSNTYVFWRVIIPNCRSGLLAGTALTFARALGEYGATSMIAGYTPGRTATIATTVYQMWRTNDDEKAYLWIAINLALSLIVLTALTFFERGRKHA